jgi:D-alanyl-D-alanine dipeptidase
MSNLSQTVTGLETLSARLLFAVFLFCLPAVLSAQNASSIAPGAKPPDVPQTLKPWIGEYGRPDGTVYVLGEKDGVAWILERQGKENDVTYRLIKNFDREQPAAAGPLPPFAPARDPADNHRALMAGNLIIRKLTPDFDGRQQVLIHPVRPVAELREQALAGSPPQENGPFRKPELVELTTLDPAIHLDIRYATTNDFLGTPVYTEARAFMQRPAAEALVRALHKLQPLGYGLLIHDAYRPWYVTKIFWDATPPEGKIFVADPKEGSRHNRGCAVDLTLYDLATGKPIEMPGTYDEMSPRSFPDYPGGTSLERWHRDLLRRAMESEGFTVYEHEWWHFDYKDWREYAILNIKFEDLHSGQGLDSAH